MDKQKIEQNFESILRKVWSTADHGHYGEGFCSFLNPFLPKLIFYVTLLNPFKI